MKRSNGTNDAAAASAGGAEERFARRVCSVLDRSAEAIAVPTLARLALARKAALRVQTSPALRRAPALQAVGGGQDAPSRFGLARAGLVLTAVLLVGGCLAGLYQIEQDRRIQDLADVDSGVLGDDLPISAYADHGFNAYLKQNP